ncbi:(2E,6E)-farnesyl diphosphate synthase [Candidatus Venteria ishoeyi]|uniref:Farnesyl diphosphate synthase n=1 Tax=Candidatus Venteria ishoeyi TaxID=1899563 RepID=A0A1H6F8X8_9GAMM|nr:farnesyl diphosphate synthase [Candidatus Venteria ishoeyi]SEH06033.1 Farnesyl diphosphate synthase [Candidatus Venteria ishoeyi]
MLLQNLMTKYRQRVERALTERLPKPGIQPAHLHEAMAYAVLGGGKRVRALLVYLIGQAFGAKPENLDAPACAVELIHAYSLVHDDLPCMDDDDLRRGKPTCHIAFGEAMAVLTGDALQTLAFQVLSRDMEEDDSGLSSEQRLQMLATLSLASGSRGMVGGQVIDMEAVGENLNLAQLENMHIHKTGALIRASVCLGALACKDLPAGAFKQLERYAHCIGLAFQIRDDILDIEANTQTLGKRQGADKALNKPTYPDLLGLGEAKKRADELLHSALDALSGFDQRADPLRWLAEFIINRTH